MNRKGQINILNVIVLFIVVVIIITLLSPFKNEVNKKTTEQDFNFSPVKQVRQTELTYDTLKRYKGFENTSEIETAKQIDAIKKLAKILYCLHINEQQTNTKN